MKNEKTVTGLIGILLLLASLIIYLILPTDSTDSENSPTSSSDPSQIGKNHSKPRENTSPPKYKNSNPNKKSVEKKGRDTSRNNATLFVTVQDTSGQPIPKATVKFGRLGTKHGAAGFEGLHKLISTPSVTNSDGNAEIKVTVSNSLNKYLSDGYKLSFYVEKTGYISEKNSKFIRPEPGGEKKVTFVLKKGRTFQCQILGLSKEDIHYLNEEYRFWIETVKKEDWNGAKLPEWDRNFTLDQDGYFVHNSKPAEKLITVPRQKLRIKIHPVGHAGGTVGKDSKFLSRKKEIEEKTGDVKTQLRLKKNPSFEGHKKIILNIKKPGRKDKITRYASYLYSEESDGVISRFSFGLADKKFRRSMVVNNHGKYHLLILAISANNNEIKNWTFKNEFSVNSLSKETNMKVEFEQGGLVRLRAMGIQSNRYIDPKKINLNIKVSKTFGTGQLITLNGMDPVVLKRQKSIYFPFPEGVCNITLTYQSPNTERIVKKSIKVNVSRGQVSEHVLNIEQ